MPKAAREGDLELMKLVHLVDIKFKTKPDVLSSAFFAVSLNRFDMLQWLRETYTITFARALQKLGHLLLAADHHPVLSWGCENRILDPNLLLWRAVCAEDLASVQLLLNFFDPSPIQDVAVLAAAGHPSIQDPFRANGFLPPLPHEAT
jgi:hypothetical protein